MTAQSSVNGGGPSASAVVSCCDWCGCITRPGTGGGTSNNNTTASGERNRQSYCASVAATANDGLAKTRRLFGHVCRQTRRESRSLLRLYCACLYNRIGSDPAEYRKSGAICDRQLNADGTNNDCDVRDGNCTACTAEDVDSATTSTSALSSTTASPSSAVSITTAIIGMNDGTPVIPILSPPESYVFLFV